MNTRSSDITITLTDYNLDCPLTIDDQKSRVIIKDMRLEVGDILTEEQAHLLSHRIVAETKRQALKGNFHKERTAVETVELADKLLEEVLESRKK